MAGFLESVAYFSYDLLCCIIFELFEKEDYQTGPEISADEYETGGRLHSHSSLWTSRLSIREGMSGALSQI